MIPLDSSDLISSGTVRDCYLHPNNPHLVIKLPAGEKREARLANIRDLRGYQILMREHVNLFCISHCYGFVTTDRGMGLMCDCIRDDNGAISKTIRNIIATESECDTRYNLQVVEEFCNFLIFKNIFLFDLNPGNIVLKRMDDGTYQPVVIDLKGRYENHEFIPLSSHIVYFARKKLKRRCDELINRILVYRNKGSWL